jgi:hypothetical protein
MQIGESDIGILVDMAVMVIRISNQGRRIANSSKYHFAHQSDKKSNYWGMPLFIKFAIP